MSDTTTPKRNEAVAYMPAHIVESVAVNLRLGNEAVFDARTRRHDPDDVPLYSQQTIDALQGEVSRLEQRFSDMRKVLFRLHAAYCEVSPNMTRAQRHEGRLALIAATEAMHPQWQGLTNLEPPTNGR